MRKQFEKTELPNAIFKIFFNDFLKSFESSDLQILNLNHPKDSINWIKFWIWKPSMAVLCTCLTSVSAVDGLSVVDVVDENTVVGVFVSANWNVTLLKNNGN